MVARVKNGDQRHILLEPSIIGICTLCNALSEVPDLQPTFDVIKH